MFIAGISWSAKYGRFPPLLALEPEAGNSNNKNVEAAWHGHWDTNAETMICGVLPKTAVTTPNYGNF